MGSIIVFIVLVIAFGFLLGPTTCVDGWTSSSIGRQGACSSHGGVGMQSSTVAIVGSAVGAFIWNVLTRKKEIVSTSVREPASFATPPQKSSRPAVRRADTNIPSQAAIRHDPSDGSLSSSQQIGKSFDSVSSRGSKTEVAAINPTQFSKPNAKPKQEGIKRPPSVKQTAPPKPVRVKKPSEVQEVDFDDQNSIKSKPSPGTKSIRTKKTPPSNKNSPQSSFDFKSSLKPAINDLPRNRGVQPTLGDSEPDTVDSRNRTTECQRCGRKIPFLSGSWDQYRHLDDRAFLVFKRSEGGWYEKCSCR